MSLRKHTLLPIGIHMNLESVHLVQMEQNDGLLSLVSRASMTFPPVETAGDIPEEAWGETDDRSSDVKNVRYREAREFVHKKCTTDGFRGRQAVISIPTEHLVIQHVRIAPMQPEELVATLPLELQGKLPFDPKTAVIRHVVVGTVSEDGKAKQDIIALAVPRDAVETHVQAVEKIGLEVVGVGVEPCAMCHPYLFCASQSPSSPGGPSTILLVHVGAMATYVAITRGEETRFVKGVALGTENLMRGIAKTRNISVEEARTLTATWRAGQNGNGGIHPDAIPAYNQIGEEISHFTNEIESCARYYGSFARGAGVDRVVLLGPGGRDRTLVAILASQLSMPLDSGKPVETVSGSSLDDDTDAELDVALGLSLFGVQ